MPGSSHHPAESVVSIGNFDGVHRGHQRLVAGVVSAARRQGAEAVVVTFDPHPIAVLRPAEAPPLLTMLRHRVALLRECGVDRVVVRPFTAELARWDPATFVERVLAVPSLGTREVHVGENFRFGHRASGDVATLAGLGEAAGFRVTPVCLVGDGTLFSSTAVRTLLARGDVQGAGTVLGRPHRLPGALARGRTDGERTLVVADALALPAAGSYVGRLNTEDGRTVAVAVAIGFGGDVRGSHVVGLRTTDDEELPPAGQEALVEVLTRTGRFDLAGRDRDRAAALRWAPPRPWRGRLRPRGRPAR